MKAGGYRRDKTAFLGSAKRALGFTRLSPVAAGFTIVETLIVLAVTGALLVSAIALVNGRDAKTQFTTSVYSLQQQFQQLINETAKGYYPNSGNFSCSPTTPVSFGSTGTGLGQNGGCIFLGKIVSFSTDSYSTLPIAGNQYASGADTTSLTGAQPVIATSLKQTVQLAGVSFVKAFADGNSASQTTMLGIFSGDSSGSFATASSPGLASGTEDFSLWSVSPATGSLALHYDASPTSWYASSAQSVSVCVAGGVNQSALITIGSSGGLDVSTKIMNGSDCS